MPWWNSQCEIFQKETKHVTFSEDIPLLKIEIKFEEAKSEFRRIRRISQNQSFHSYVNTIRGHTSKVVWNKVKKIFGCYPDPHNISFLKFNGHIISDAKEIANVIGQKLSDTSSEKFYPDDFIVFKRREEKQALDFLPSYGEVYNSGFYV
ncbi:hypothetical protein AVEN_101903-1 [Araneus ventricosus]|uniref:Uncharacterized protein n=1 Tax=Araneus ventricosus TaxID=182803 RepID=A0A4Y2DAJ5_ARAVE|nr:hypothetical protein AVEN_240638-1 [Araneus ventricosus]GBM13048.1 hypothetical protein AVEN_101903-1 [Araneus ventricosus]